MDLSMDAAPREDSLSGAAVARGGGGRSRARFFALAAALVAALFAGPVARHVRAAELLVAFTDAQAKPAVTDEELTVDASLGGAPRPVRARLYLPAGKSAREVPGVVLVHGVHHLGIEEPRLRRFARAIASAGVAVLTPEVEELSDYQVAPRSIETVGAAVRALRARGTGHPVGLMGTSFGGGVALLAAADPRFAEEVAFVVAVGAHDDLARVSRFFATDRVEEPGGETESLHAHEYGATVLVYSHAEDFFPEADVPAARDALRFWLWEERDRAREAAARLSPASKAKVEHLFAADLGALRPELLSEIGRRADDMAKVSPHGRLGGLRAPVYLLHGAGDRVVPASETRWLAKDVPRDLLRDVLVSPAIVHVELKEPSRADQWALVHFMAHVLGAADDAG